MLRWFTLEWYRYLFLKNTGLCNILCKMRGHSSGPIFYNLSGLEPDWHCSNCSEFIG